MAILEHIATGRIFVPRSRSVVGRAATADCELSDGRASGEHAALYWDGAWFLRDLGSRNGSFVGDARVLPGEDRQLELGDVVSFGGGEERWQLLDLGAPASDVQAPALPATVEATRSMPAPEVVGLELKVSADEEYIEVLIDLTDRRVNLAPRTFHDVLLVLARRRLEDEGVRQSEAGWVYFDELCTMLGRERTRVNVEVYRARQQLADLGVARAVDLFERRATTRQIRLGVAKLAVRPL